MFYKKDGVMKLSRLFVVTFGIGVISYPALNLPYGAPHFADRSEKQADPAPKPEKSTKSDFAYHIIINIPSTKLSVYDEDELVMELPVAVGQAIYKTPTGYNEIKELIWNPWWYPPKADWAKDEEITPPGPANPLGPVKIVLGDEIRIHGTTTPSSIGRAASHGCIRLNSKDAITLAWFLQEHLTNKSDKSYLEKYKKFPTESFYVKLDEAVPVNIIYDPIAINDGNIIIYPDYYNKISSIKEVAAWKLFAYGIDPWALNLDGLSKTKKTPKEISIRDLM